MRTYILSFILAYSVTIVVGHSWLDCINVTNPYTVTNLGDLRCNGYPRGYVGRSNPDANMQKIVNVDNAGLEAYAACRYSQNSYTAQYPRLVANAGSDMVIAYTPNGHTMWMGPPPPNGPRNFTVRWTGKAGTQLTTMKDVMGAAILLSVQFDQPCHSWVDGRQLDPSAGICQAKVRIPSNTPSGLYQFVWWWPFRFAGNNVIEDYTSCWDVQVTGTSQASTTSAVATTSVATTSAATTSAAATSSTAATSSSVSTSSTSSSGNDGSSSSTTGQTVTSTSGSAAPFSNYLTPTDDSYVKGGAFSSMNYYYYNLFVQGNKDANLMMESYLRFNVSSFGTAIGSLQLYLTNADPSIPLNMFVSVCEDNEWMESSITWDNKPSTCTAAIGKVGTDGIANIDASIAVKSIVDGTLTIKLWNPPTVTQSMSVYSKEAGDSSYIPVLYVVQGGAGAEDVVTTGSSANSLMGSLLFVAPLLLALLF